MTEREAFVAAIAANPGEDTPRLAFADWLQENGEDDRAQFVRLSCEVAACVRASDYLRLWPDDLNESCDRTDELLKLRGPFWFDALYRALGCEETGPPPPRGWAGRLWDRVAGEHRFCRHNFDRNGGGSFRLHITGNGPVREIDVWRGLAEGINIDFGSPFPIPDFAEAVRLEPIHNLSFNFAANPRLWRSLDGEGLSRTSNLGLRLPASPGRRDSVALADLLDSDNWAGLRELHAWCPGVDHQAISHGSVHQLAHAPLLSGLQSLIVNVGRTDLPLLANSAHTRNLRELRVWGCDLPPLAADALCRATFRPNLETLDLSLNNLRDDGARRLTVVVWPRLRKLDLGANGLTDACVPHLLPLASQLAELSLATNHIEDDGARRLADALDPDTLVRFWLSYNPLSAGVVAELRERFGERFQYRARDDSDRFDDLLEFPTEPT